MSLFSRISIEEFRKFAEPEIYDGDNYIKRTKVMENVYKCLFVIYCIIGITSLVMFYKLRNWYIIKQRNFVLTFINGVFAFFSGFVTLLFQFQFLPCAFTLYVSNVVNPFYNAIFLSRSLRIVLLYKYNIFKVTAINKRRKTNDSSFMGAQEPNYYLPKIYEKVDKIIYAVIAVPTIIAFCVTLFIHYNNSDFCTTDMGRNSLSVLKENGPRIQKIYIVAQVSGVIMAIAMSFTLFFLSKVKDSSKYGAKFECISTIILIVTITLLNMIINGNVGGALSTYNEGGKRVIEPNQCPMKLLVVIYDYTKGGKALFCIISTYMIFSSILLPCLKCYKSKKEKNRYFHEPTSSIQYFYKVLNSPPLLEELKTIAIKEFSVENVLFWENYQLLQKMIYRYQVEFRKAEKVGNPRLVSQYDFEGYYQQQLAAFSVSSMDDYSYDPNMPVPREIMPYYVSFYQTFIDSMGPASVNISGSTIKQIYSEMCTYPTIGMFDNAKNEIVEMMYSSIFPILLRQNRKQLNNATGALHY